MISSSQTISLSRTAFLSVFLSLNARWNGGGKL